MISCTEQQSEGGGHMSKLLLIVNYVVLFCMQ